MTAQEDVARVSRLGGVDAASYEILSERSSANLVRPVSLTQTALRLHSSIGAYSDRDAAEQNAYRAAIVIIAT